VADDTGGEVLLPQSGRLIPAPTLQTEPVDCAVCQFRAVFHNRGPAEASVPIVVLKHGYCLQCYRWLIRESASLAAGHLIFRKQNTCDWRP
jgi:hypothetical protein